MVTELATWTNTPGFTVGSTSIANGAQNSTVTSGRVLTATIGSRSGVLGVDFYGVDPSGGTHDFVGALDATTKTYLVNLLQTLAQALVTSVASGTTITFTAGSGTTLATWTNSPSIATSSTTVANGVKANPPIVSGKVTGASVYLQGGSPWITFYGVDQSQQAQSVSGALDTPTQTSLLNLLQSVGQTAITVIAASSVITFSAG